jgi:hypothetical protein
MSRILGQDRPLEVVGNALASGRFHHAWIFSGPRGVGKFTAAMRVARILLDAESQGSSVGDLANPQSRVQKMIDAGTHPDLHVIRKELALYSENPQLRERKLMNIPLDLLRERMLGGWSGERNHEAAAYRTAALGHGKVFIIDEAELLDTRGQDAMLKTLEEPPAETYFFLVTSNPNRLLSTIHSRSQHVRFGRLTADDMRAWWKQHVASPREEVTAPPEGKGRKAIEAFDPRKTPAQAVQWAFEYAEGSPGMALLALEYGFDQWHATLAPMVRDLDNGRFPPAMGERLGAMVEDFAQAWVKRHGSKNTSKDAANKDGARHVLWLLSSHARRRLAVSAADCDALERWSEVIDALRECERQIDCNVNQKLALENLVAQWRLALSGAGV